MGFLLVILSIWWMLVWQEVRRCSLWWSLLISTPVVKEARKAVEIKYEKVTEDEDGREKEVFQVGEIKIHGQPRWHKLFTAIVILIPRTVVCVCLAVVGTLFLLEADDYTDLILNSVALGFLIDIDDMLYAAIVGASDKFTLGKIQDVHWHWPVCPLFNRARKVSKGWMRGLDKPEMPNMLVIILVCAISIYYVYYTNLWGEGKIVKGQALNCLCQAEGHQCLNAQILGAYAHCADLPEPCNGLSENLNHRFLR